MKKLLLIVAVLLLAGCGPELPLRPDYTQCSHDFGQWGDPKMSSDWYNGTYMVQARACLKCNLAESRVVKVAPHAINTESSP